MYFSKCSAINCKNTIDNEHSLRGIKRKECFGIFKIKSFQFFCTFLNINQGQEFSQPGKIFGCKSLKGFFSVWVSGFSIYTF